LNPKYVAWLPSGADIVQILRESGSPEQVYLISCSSTLDGKAMQLAKAVNDVEIMPENGWGTIISCIPGELAYYYDEEGERRAILQRKPSS
jgi:hypothetical protein